jgi:hypothetical protein
LKDAVKKQARLLNHEYRHIKMDSVLCTGEHGGFAAELTIVSSERSRGNKISGKASTRSPNHASGLGLDEMVVVVNVDDIVVVVVVIVSLV